MTTETSPSVLLICGSIAEKSHTNALLHYIENLLQEKNASTRFWDLRIQPLIIAQPEYHHDPSKSPNEQVRTFSAAVEKADAIILGSPLYHGSYSGVLKNALDNLKSDAFKNKPIGLVSNSSGPRAGISACEHLRIVVRTLYGYALQSHIGTYRSDYTEEPTKYVLNDTEIQDRCHHFVDELLKLEKLLK